MLYAAFSALRALFPGATAADLSWVLNAYTVVYAAMLVPGRRPRRPPRPQARVPARRRDLPGRVGGLRAGRRRRLADRRARAAGDRRGAADAGLAVDRARRLSAEQARGRRQPVGRGRRHRGRGRPSLGSLRRRHLGWPWAFFINLPIGALSLWCGAAVLRESGGPTHRAAARPRRHGAADRRRRRRRARRSSRPTRRAGARELVAAGGAGLLALAGFVAWARRARSAARPGAVPPSAPTALVNLATLTFGIAFAMMFFTFFFFMGGVWHYSLPHAGLAIAPGPLLVMPAAIITGRLAARLGHRPFLVGGSLLYAAAGFWFLLVPGSEPAYLTQWLPGLVLSGIGVGMVLPSLSAAAVKQAAGGALRGRQRGQPGDAADRRRDRRRRHRAAARPRRPPARRLQCGLLVADRPRVADRGIQRDGRHPASRSDLRECGPARHAAGGKPAFCGQRFWNG